MAEAKAINRYLLKLRKERSWLQDEAARKCGWDQAKTSKLETGVRTPSIDDLAKIAKAFGVELDMLVKIRVRAA